MAAEGDGAVGDQYGDAATAITFPRSTPPRNRRGWPTGRETLATLDSIPFDELSPEEKVNAQVFRTSLRALANDVRFRTYEAPFNSDTFFWTEFTPRQGFATVAAYRAYLGRLRDVPRYFDEQIANMRAGLARGYTVPRVSVVGRDKTIEPYVKGDTTNPLYVPFTQMPATISAADQAALRAEAATVLRDIVAPAYAKLLTMMRGEYLPKARTTLAATTMPDGDAYYQAMIEKFTTLNLTAQQIHDIGLKEVARIKAEMEATKQKANFAGTMAGVLPLSAHRSAVLRQDAARAPRVLGVRVEEGRLEARRDDRDAAAAPPRHPAGARRARAHLYGRTRRPRGVPDEHVQPAGPAALHARVTHPARVHAGPQLPGGARARGPRASSVPPGTSFSGYGEGWGLYTEWLGTVMGIYETPYEDFGRLTYEMWRASRLVIDTGIHQFGWTREQAMDYLRGNAALSEHEITTEVERYIAWPGQALAYKLGELADPPAPSRGGREAGPQVRSAALPRRDPRAGLGPVARVGAANGAVHRRRRRKSAGGATAVGGRTP